ncbi:glycine-rich RNA-binding protein 1-like [Triticum urartu]|uniref:HMA domain-containing protein n=1 Tax=Triticum urartu TaxID=4572 RepID=A0A8R7UF49_TRIUA|nr:glycine-rich RNA-binding protein 1-like [Triticum urartu]
MVKQKIVLKLALDDERKRRKAFKAAVGMSGVTSATMEGDKIIIVGDGVDPITLTTMLRRSLGYAELLSVSSGDDKKKDGYGAAYGYGGGEKKKDGYGYGGADGGGSGMSFGGKEGGGSKGGGGGGGYSQNAVAPVTYPAYQQYNAMPSYPVYSYPAPAYQHQEQDPGCSIM